MKVFRSISQLVTLRNVVQKDGRFLRPDDLSIIANAAMVFDENQIIWVGEDQKLPVQYLALPSENLAGFIVLPGLVDSHTHLVFGGDRSTEYLSRLNGADYLEIAKQGGGILSSMRQTRAASEEELFDLSVQRIERMHAKGVKTIEIKSGYGLNFEAERKQTNVIHRLKQNFAPKVKIVSTFCAAHAIPPEFSKATDYIEAIVLPLMEEFVAENKIDIVDVFHEKGFFSTEDVIRIFNQAQKLGLNRKLHADEFFDNHGAALGMKYDCLSVDHLLCSNDQAIQNLAKSQTVATFLPGTGYFLGKPQANVRKFLDAGVKVAIATDYNPGSCHLWNLPLLLKWVTPNYKMNATEAISSITYNAASALGLKKYGALIEGFQPTFSLFNHDSLADWFYSWNE